MGCESSRDVGPCLVFEQNKSRAENAGFPSVMEVGEKLTARRDQMMILMEWSRHIKSH